MKPVGWRCADRVLEISRYPLIMGIVNVTPDSFSDGGRHGTVDAAVAHGRRLLEEGADILDIGGESTRPGAEAVSLDEELRRVIPVVRALASATGCVISVDTRKAEVARQALGAGARIVNDVSALTGDPRMAEVVAAAGAGLVLMHMRGTPETMQADPRYDDVVGEVMAFFRERLRAAESAGIARESLAVDPGIGFGKLLEHNLALMAHAEVFAGLGVPVVVGASRKRFIGAVTGRPVEDRLAGSLACAAVCACKGVHVLRVHDAGASRDAARVAGAIALAGEGRHGVVRE
jgi:dihydropteroate synthase